MPTIIRKEGAYPQISWLIKPYTNNIRKQNSIKNYRASEIVERGSGLLKGRCLLKRLDNDIENVTSIITSSFILDNILQINGNNYKDVVGVTVNNYSPKKITPGVIITREKSTPGVIFSREKFTPTWKKVLP